MNTVLSPESSQPELFPLAVMAQHSCLLPETTGLTPYAQRTIRRAINLLDKYLRQPGMSFTSSTAARDWLRYSWQDKNGKCLWCSISITSTVYWRVKRYLPVRLTMSRSIPVRW